MWASVWPTMRLTTRPIPDATLIADAQLASDRIANHSRPHPSKTKQHTLVTLLDLSVSHCIAVAPWPKLRRQKRA